MEIKWIGNTSFLIKNSTGKRILLDPMQIYPHIEKYDLNPDIITFSHTHNNEIINEHVDKNCIIINSACSYSNHFVSLEGYKTFKDDFYGYKRGENIIYLLNIDEFKICHLGSLGHQLDDELLNKLTNLDFLFIPIGGHFCLDGFSAAKLALSLKPKYIIPMFFKTSSEYFYLDGPHKFLSSLKNILSYNTNTIYSNDLSFKDRCSVILLSA
ncbi:MBL fold metallo-hydrolase [Clostridium sp.]|uniref:MBL fold metallo-hydrolase n=1 Tax=Clostridium sp. TaxID=1506 RepID=UPI0025BEBEE9|nr:MBL fold metallo-hydrolase [Clostridium sp.]